MGFINLQPTSKYYVGKYKLANSKWYAPGYLAATQLGVNYQLRAAFACRMVCAAANGQYYKYNSVYGPSTGVRPWEDCATVANGGAAPAALQHYIAATKPATWAKWQAIAAAQGLQ